VASLAEWESSFIRRIDACFPYDDAAKATALIREAVSISPNMAFAVLEETCRPPRGTPVLKSRQLELLDEWRLAFSHTLADPVAECARSLIHGKSLPIGWVLKLFDEMAAHVGQYAALNIAYASADRSKPEDAALLDQKEEEIRNRWDTNIAAKTN